MKHCGPCLTIVNQIIKSMKLSRAKFRTDTIESLVLDLHCPWPGGMAASIRSCFACGKKGPVYGFITNMIIYKQ